MKPMLAAKAVPAKLKFPLCAQLKLDGIRCVIVDGKPLTRSLKEIPNREIFDALSDSKLEGFDGEIIVGPILAKDAYRRTASFVMAPDKTGEPWCFHVFDRWDSSLGFEDRHRGAASIAGLAAAPNSLRIRMLGYATANNAAELEDFERAILLWGGEGVILRDPAGRYKFGRSSVTKGELLKLKRFTDFEAEVIGVYELMHNGNEPTRNALGRTERSSAQAGLVGTGTLGGLILRALNGPWAGVEFRCGTGFTADYRRALWELAADGLLGKTAKIKAFEVGAKDKPRFPVWLGWRDRSDFDV